MMQRAVDGSGEEPLRFVRLGVVAEAFRHTSILASAGSGKTYALTNRYLQLVAEGAAPATILASTFTRLAAAEIRDRVLKRLSEAAVDDRKRAELAHALALREPGALTSAASANLLARLVRQMHMLQLRTLDSFLAGVVHASSIELGLPIGAAVIDETQESFLRREAIALMLDEHKADSLVELLRQLTQGESSRSVTRSIDDVVTKLYDVWRETTPESWDWMQAPAGRLKAHEVQQAIELLEAHAPHDDKRFIKAHGADVARARALEWTDFITSGLAWPIACGAGTYYGKDIEPAVMASYQPLVHHALAEVTEGIRLQTLATRDMLTLFHEQFEMLKRSRGVLTFRDLVMWSQRAVNEDTLAMIAFRLDAQVRHLLLDEFQDTSVAQWRALQPIVEEIVSTAPPDRTFFCVGDVKQSIYGWRDAAPEVLEGLPAILEDAAGSAIEVRTLAKSYRSSPRVIEVVNRVFEGVLENPALGDFAPHAKSWAAGYEAHQSAKSRRQGYVELRVVERAQAQREQRSLRLRQAAELTEKLHQQRPDRTIGVLVRRNGSVARMLMELGPSRLNVRASGRGGGPLTDAPAVNALLDLLRLVDHPDDTVSAFNVARSPLGAVVGLDDYADRDQRTATANRMRERLLVEGYAMTLARLAAAISPQCDGREIGRVHQLIDLAGEFDRSPTLRADDFVAVASVKKVAATEPAPVQVMTVHQAKGLDFDIVILPELDWDLVGRSPSVLFERAGVTGEIARVTRTASAKVRALTDGLVHLHDVYVHRAVRESLSVLYVAMTRAKYAMHVMIDPPSENEKTIRRSASNIVRFALSPDDTSPGRTAFTHGDPNWQADADDAPHARIPTPSASGSTQTIRLRPSANISVDRVSSPSAAAEEAGPFGGPWKMSLDREARARGTAIHALAEQIEWLETFDVPDAELMRAVRAALPRQDASWCAARVEEFRTMLTSPEVIAALTRPGAMAGRVVHVRRELPIARLDADGVQRGFIDRLVYAQQGATIADAEVIDFKTDAVSEATIAEAAEHHRAQLEHYRTAAAELLGIDERQISMKLVFLRVGRVVTL